MGPKRHNANKNPKTLSTQPKSAQWSDRVRLAVMGLPDKTACRRRTNRKCIDNNTRDCYSRQKYWINSAFKAPPTRSLSRQIRRLQQLEPKPVTENWVFWIALNRKINIPRCWHTASIKCRTQIFMTTKTRPNTKRISVRRHRLTTQINWAQTWKPTT